MELQSAIENRRSTRSLTKRALTRTEIEEILRAGTLAPSACNMQSWYFYIIADEREREKLKEVCQDWIASAPVVFLVCTDDNGIVSRFGERSRKFPMQDTALAMENMLLKAEDMGLGGCIIGAYKQEKITEIFSIPKEHTVVALLPIGEPKEKIPPRERKPLSEVSSYIGKIPEAGMLNPANEAKSLELKNVCLSKAQFGCCEECEKEGKYCVEMKKSVFDSVDMSASQLNHCLLEEAVLTDIRMAGAKLYDIDLDESDLSGVNMVKSRLQCTNLYGASVKNCCFANTSLENCDIAGMTIDGVDAEKAIREYKENHRN